MGQIQKDAITIWYINYLNTQVELTNLFISMNVTTCSPIYIKRFDGRKF